MLDIPDAEHAFQPPRMRPLAALRAIRGLLRDPDDTARVFEVVDALSGRTGPRLFARFAATPTGARLLRERPDLRATLADLDPLAELPRGSLGRAYAEFAIREAISVDGLLAASDAGRAPAARPPSDVLRFFDERIRVMHDLWHVVAGYDRSLVGEAALLAFTFAQTGNPAFAALLIGIYAGTFGRGRGRPPAPPGTRRAIHRAWRRGRRAAWLPAQAWEELLERPLGEIREELGLGATAARRETSNGPGEALCDANS